MDKIIGSEIKIKINVTDIDVCKFSATQFEAKFYTTNINTNCYTIQKDQMTKIDDDTYICIVDSSITGLGVLNMQLTIYIPDDTCADGQRTEILREVTDVKIIE